MLEVTEKILASIYATPMTYSEISNLPYLKTISDYGISFSIETLLKDGFIKEKVIDRGISKDYWWQVGNGKST